MLGLRMTTSSSTSTVESQTSGPCVSQAEVTTTRYPNDCSSWTRAQADLVTLVFTDQWASTAARDARAMAADPRSSRALSPISARTRFAFDGIDVTSDYRGGVGPCAMVL